MPKNVIYKLQKLMILSAIVVLSKSLVFSILGSPSPAALRKKIPLVEKFFFVKNFWRIGVRPRTGG
jgi:hypothetical protein